MNHPHWTASLHHDGSPRYVTSPGAFRLGDTVTLRLRADRDAPVEDVYLRTTPDGEKQVTRLDKTWTEGVCRWWETRLSLTMPVTNYRFYVVTGEGIFWLSAAGLTRYEPADATDFKLLADYAAPDWVRDSVFYQIFPDRFYDGDPSNNVQTDDYARGGLRTLARPWGARPRSYREARGIEFFGGDLPGVVQKLDYVSDLGANALYLNPVFTAPSNHKYDITDFRTVDPHFGGNAALVALREALDARGMRLILDVTPNHCGHNHPWFLAAQADPGAPTAGYFTFHRHPDDYESWSGHKSLVKLNYRSERLRQEMYAGEDAILRGWLRAPFRIDGWRLDVANMTARQGAYQMAPEVWRELRTAVKVEFPGAYLMGEHFYDSSPLLQGDMLDATMNYRAFSLPLIHWLAGVDTTTAALDGVWQRSPLPGAALAEQWRLFMGLIPWQSAVQQFNLLCSHDTPRILHLLGGDKARLRAAAALLFTFPGVPSVYYGDEIGLDGGHDPDNRRCMIWDEGQWDHDLRAYYRALAHLRRESPALRWGGFQVIYAVGDTVAMLRDSPEEQIIVVVRRGEDGLDALPVRHAGLPDGVSLVSVLDGGQAVIAGGMLPLRGSGPAQIWRTAR